MPRGGLYDYRRIYLFGGAALALLLGLVIWLLVSDEPSPPGSPGPADPAFVVIDAGTPPAADAAVVELQPDVAADTRPRPRATRIITAKEIHRLQRRYGGVIKLCYDRAARRAASLVSRKATVTVQLADGGRIRNVTVTGAGNEQLAACLRRVVRQWRFSRTLKAQPVTFPIVFAR